MSGEVRTEGLVVFGVLKYEWCEGCGCDVCGGLCTWALFCFFVCSKRVHKYRVYFLILQKGIFTDSDEQEGQIVCQLEPPSRCPSCKQACQSDRQEVNLLCVACIDV